MALTATMFHVEVALSDVDRGVYEALDLRLARHPSESTRYLVTRLLAYCLAFEEGITFSKGGLSSAAEAPIAIYDKTGLITAWIDVGSPSAERLHKASKAAPRVSVYTTYDLAPLKREIAKKPIFRAEQIEAFSLSVAFVDEVGERIEKNTKLELVHTGGSLYATMGKTVLEGTVTRFGLTDSE